MGQVFKVEVVINMFHINGFIKLVIWDFYSDVVARGNSVEVVPRSASAVDVVNGDFFSRPVIVIDVKSIHKLILHKNFSMLVFCKSFHTVTFCE